MFTRIARIATYIALMSPLIVNRGLFFPFITGKAIFFRIFIELGLAAGVAGLIMGEYSLAYIKNRLNNPIVKAIGLFALLFTITSLTSEHPALAFWSNFERGEGAWQILHYVALFGLLRVFFATKADWLRLMAWQSWMSVLVGLYAVGQAMNVSFIIDPPTGNLSGTLGNTSYLGGYLLFSAIFTLYLAFENTKKSPNILWLSVFLFQMIMFWTTKTRGSFGALGTGIAIALFLFARTNKKGLRHNLILAGISAVAIAGLVGAILTVKGDALHGMKARFWTWSSSASAVIERPILGWGAENFPVIFDKYYDPRHYGIESWFDRAHNAMLEYATAGGILLLGAYLFIFFTLYRALLRGKRDRLWPIFMAVPAMYLVNGLVLFEILPLYILLFFMTAAIAAYVEGFDYENKDVGFRMYENKNRRISTRSALLVIPAIVLLVSLYETAWRPLEKNLLILESVNTNGKTDDQLFSEYKQALEYRSPVGEQEAAQNLFSFTVGYTEFLKKNNLVSKISQEKWDSIVKMNDDAYQNGLPRFVGTKPLYAYATALISVAQATGNNKYLTRMHELVTDGEALAPTRIEWVRFRMVMAVLENDTKAYVRAVKAGKLLRSDLPWEDDVRKFTY